MPEIYISTDIEADGPIPGPNSISAFTPVKKMVIPILVLDLNGEMIDAAKSLGGLVITLPDARQFGISLNMITPQELVAVALNVQTGTIYAELIEMARDRLRGEIWKFSYSDEELDR